jgi:hypothetical protein
MSDATLIPVHWQPERPQLQRYHTDDHQLVIYNPKEPLAWISADPSHVMEVDDA